MKQKRTVEDYLKTILQLSSRGEAHNSDIAAALGVSRPTVTVSLRQMAQEGYLTIQQDHTVRLTERGEKLAREVLDRNQTFRTFLRTLGVDEETAVKDACEMEHAISRVSFEALKRFLQQQGQCAGDGAGGEAL